MFVRSQSIRSRTRIPHPLLVALLTLGVGMTPACKPGQQGQPPPPSPAQPAPAVAPAQPAPAVAPAQPAEPAQAVAPSPAPAPVAAPSPAPAPAPPAASPPGVAPAPGPGGESPRDRPQNPALDAKLLAGRKLFNQGQLELAAKQFREAAALAPERPECQVDLGRTLFRLGRSKEALAALREAVRLGPKDMFARENLAFVLSQSGQSDAAIAELLPLVQQVGSTHPLNCTLAAAYARAKKTTELAALKARVPLPNCDPMTYDPIRAYPDVKPQGSPP